MSRPNKADRRRENARREFAGKAWTAIVLGVMFLVVAPLFMRSPMTAMLAIALRPAGWTALAIGTALLALHYVLRRISASSPVEQAPPQRAIKSQDTKAAAVTAPQQTPSAPWPQATQQWSPAALASIEWRRFEAICEAFYAQAGLATRSQSHGADGGVDIWPQSKHMSAPRIVQCKHWLGKPVGVKEMREFRGVMASHQLQSGTYVTSSTFTADATAFAKANGIQLQDGAALLKLIGQRTPEQQAALLAVAYEGEYWKPTCASCGIKTVERERKRDGGKFWGCSNYPRCKTHFAMRSA
ncbi:restriction endonuclease [Variovorax sp. PAMC 28711]|uniref:restriction endonuclease n=1 Tax=Variovorax sp. PAMC 28711 TaxID=1795631 RepID=UPI00078CC407|nr:restriction endonuclease [Variovorax sp. PAMC 28711]AMM23400.1 restriction endonuclease [Variovorax sp. PAMC 28711]